MPETKETNAELKLLINNLDCYAPQTVPLCDAIKYAQKLKTIRIPRNSCAYGIFCSIRYNYHNYLPLDFSGTKQALSVEPIKFEIFLRINRNNECPSWKCQRTMADGQCKDKFVIKHFASKFWPDKYKTR